MQHFFIKICYNKIEEIRKENIQMSIPNNQKILEQRVGLSNGEDFFLTTNSNRSQYTLYKGKNKTSAVKVKTSVSIDVLLEYIENELYKNSKN